MQGEVKYSPVHRKQSVYAPPSAQVDKVLDVEANPLLGDYKVGAMQGGLDGMKRRHKMWINKRRFQKGQTAKWRPEKRHRVSAKRFLRMADSQFKANTDRQSARQRHTDRQAGRQTHKQTHRQTTD